MLSDLGFEGVGFPRADVQEVVEALVGNAQGLGDGLSTFTLEGGKKAADGRGQARPLFGVVEGFEVGKQEVSKRFGPGVRDRHVSGSTRTARGS